jgi:hypothetical protein
MSGQGSAPVTDAANGSGSAAPPATNASTCRAQVFATCVREQIESCRHDAVKEFVDEKDNLKFLFDPPAPAAGSGGSSASASAAAAESKDSGGCQVGGGAGGLLLVGAAIVGVSRRRRRARD